MNEISIINTLYLFCGFGIGFLVRLYMERFIRLVKDNRGINEN